MTEKWVELTTTQGAAEAEILSGLLEAQGITTTLTQEAAGRVYGFSVGPLGEVSILVKSSELPQAQKILEEYLAGGFATDEEWPDDSPTDSA